jgi:hypothetical protein
MGSVQTKEDIITPTTTPVKIQKQITEQYSYISPLQKVISSASSYEDPRSPGSRRTPVSSPNSLTPTLLRRERMKRLGSASKLAPLDPRSPSIRTPLQLSTADPPRTPPPFNSTDPRSPYMMRTPLTLSAQDAVVVDDLIIVGQEIMGGAPLSLSSSSAEAEVVVVASEEKADKVLSSSAELPASEALESTSIRHTVETYSSPDVSAGIMALVMSPLNSPSLGSRKRKDIARVHALSPLKKSYSAPMDENTPPSPSPVMKAIAVGKMRTPLSPLTQLSINSRQCKDVQPIKFRMDPGILG